MCVEKKDMNDRDYHYHRLVLGKLSVVSPDDFKRELENGEWDKYISVLSNSNPRTCKIACGIYHIISLNPSYRELMILLIERRGLDIHQPFITEHITHANALLIFLFSKFHSKDGKLKNNSWGMFDFFIDRGVSMEVKLNDQYDLLTRIDKLVPLHHVLFTTLFLISKGKWIPPNLIVEECDCVYGDVDDGYFIPQRRLLIPQFLPRLHHAIKSKYRGVDRLHHEMKIAVAKRYTRHRFPQEIYTLIVKKM